MDHDKFTDLNEATSLTSPNNRSDINENNKCSSPPEKKRRANQIETGNGTNTTNTVTSTDDKKESDVDEIESQKRKGGCLRICNKANRKRIKRPLPCLFAWMLLLSSTGAYYCLVTPQLYEIINDMTSWLVLIVIQSVLFFNCVLNFSIAILRDPGRFRKFVILPDDPNYNDDTKSPLYKDIYIKGTKVKIKWCSVSLIIFSIMYNPILFMLYRHATSIDHRGVLIVAFVTLALIILTITVRGLTIVLVSVNSKTLYRLEIILILNKRSSKLSILFPIPTILVSTHVCDIRQLSTSGIDYFSYYPAISHHVHMSNGPVWSAHFPHRWPIRLSHSPSQQRSHHQRARNRQVQGSQLFLAWLLCQHSTIVLWLSYSEILQKASYKSKEDQEQVESD